MVQVRDSLTVSYSLIHYEIIVIEEERPEPVALLVSQDEVYTERTSISVSGDATFQASSSPSGSSYAVTALSNHNREGVWVV